MFKVHISNSFSYFTEHIVCRIMSTYGSVVIALNMRSCIIQDLDVMIISQAPVCLINANCAVVINYFVSGQTRSKWSAFAAWMISTH